jgi:L-fucose isomerase-like protein
MDKSFCPFTRRQFGLTMCGLPFSFRALAQEFASTPWNEPAVVAKVYLASPTVYWPKPTLDVQNEVAEVETKLAEVQRKNSHNVRFVGGEVIRNAAEVRPWLDKIGDVDGILILPVSQPMAGLGEIMDAVQVPSLFFSRPYATHAWSSVGALQKSGKKVDVIATTSYGDLDPYLRAFRTARHMRRSKVLVGDAKPDRRQVQAEAYTKWFGTSFQFVSGGEFKDAFQSIDEKAAQKRADEFVRGALKVVEPSPKEIRDGLRFYLALSKMMKEQGANAVTIDCFGTLAANTLPGYPCIAFSKFNDAGLYGVCEGDLASTMTQLLVTSYSGKPGFVTDPVFDISRNEVIHAHCVSATKMQGIDGPSYPYIIRNHLETNEGAVLQVLMPSGETVTVARFTGPQKMLISTAEVTGIPDSDRGCRSQVRTRVKDAERWLRNYTAGLHRVMFYGDHVYDIQRMGRLMGFAVVDEIES